MLKTNLLTFNSKSNFSTLPLTKKRQTFDMKHKEKQVCKLNWKRVHFSLTHGSFQLLRLLWVFTARGSWNCKQNLQLRSQQQEQRQLHTHTQCAARRVCVGTVIAFGGFGWAEKFVPHHLSLTFEITQRTAPAIDGCGGKVCAQSGQPPLGRMNERANYWRCTSPATNCHQAAQVHWQRYLTLASAVVISNCTIIARDRWGPS